MPQNIRTCPLPKEQLETMEPTEKPTFLDVFEATQCLHYDKQAQWLLNGYWTDIFGPDEVLREKLWKIVRFQRT